MNQDVFQLARQLQKKLERLNPERDRDTLVWVHGFLSGVISHVENAIPALQVQPSTAFSPTERAEPRPTLHELAARVAAQSRERDEPDRLDEIERDLAGEDPAGLSGVPVKRKPGPGGRRGGA